ncbi:MAG: hypothetical protein Ct9H300mP6_08960 [Gammaproteobacteria bacterium]|nr:MAG: hypothetical protein Ct9H300mP6_08960 [Gammaproteobacteria bacterium]
MMGQTLTPIILILILGILIQNHTLEHPFADWSFCGYDYAQDIIALPRAKKNAVLMKSTYDISPDVNMNTVLMISQTDADSRMRVLLLLLHILQ